MTREELASLNMSVLRTHAASIGLGAQFGEKKEELINRIILVEQQMKPKKEEKKTIEVKAPVQAPSIKFEELETLLDEYVKKGLILEPRPDNCFYMRYGLKEDSGTLNQPARTIVNRASILVR